MILINKTAVEVQDLNKTLGIKIPLDILKKKPLFEINPALIFKDPANGPLATKNRNMMEFPCYFNATTKGGKSVEIRYCTNRTPDPKFMGQTEKYSPRVVEFDGKAEFISDDLDKAVYFWLHFFNKTSPFRKAGLPHEYELVDDNARATTLIESITLRSKATAHASELSGDALRITAKGMKIAGADKMDDLSIKAQLMQYASDKPAEYLNKAESQVNHIEGLIRDSIDKGIFIVENVFNSKRWRWAQGVKQGEVIIEMSTSVSDDAQALITHISQNITEFLPVLINTAKTVNAKTNLEKNLEGINVFDMLKGEDGKGNSHTPVGSQFGNKTTVDSFDSLTDEHNLEEIQRQIDEQNNESNDFDEDNDGNSQNDLLDGLPTNYKEAQEYLGEKIGKKTPALASELNTGITNGTINNDNIEMILAEYRER